MTMAIEIVVGKATEVIATAIIIIIHKYKHVMCM